MKIALGTVQWGLDYGISNSSGIPSDEEINSILTKAYKNDICVFDTAANYGNSELRLGATSYRNRKVITKVGELNGKTLENALQLSLGRLKINNVYGYLFHKPKILFNNKNLWRQMKKLKKIGLTQNIGFSLYEPNELETLLNKNMIPDIVQIPYSLLDRKFESYISYLKSMGVEIHVRSIFLQGLYFKKISELGGKFKSLKIGFMQLNSIRKKYNYSILDLALGFVKQNKSIDYIVLGIETKAQLEAILNSYRLDLSEEIFEEIKKIKVDNTFILNPVNW